MTEVRIDSLLSGAERATGFGNCWLRRSDFGFPVRSSESNGCYDGLHADVWLHRKEMSIGKGEEAHADQIQ
jgi:hypothetical protein